jgi:hypothetical protein
MKKTLVLMLTISLATLAIAQNYKVHTVFMYSFTRYVQWPAEYNQGDFEIMVLGDSPILDELNEMAKSRKAGDRTIKITKINNPSDIRKCNMIFVPDSKAGQIGKVLGTVGSQSIMVVSESDGAGLQGSDINFVIKDGKLAFELNQAAVSKKNLKVSIELSRLAILL